MRQSIIKCGHDIEVVIGNLDQRCHIRDGKLDIESSGMSLSPSPIHHSLTYVRGNYLMAKGRKAQSLRSNAARAVQHLQGMATTVLSKNAVQNPSLPLDCRIPVVEDQVVVICERFVTAQDFFRHSTSFANLDFPESAAVGAGRCLGKNFDLKHGWPLLAGHE